jgi:hypothetical protein
MQPHDHNLKVSHRESGEIEMKAKILIYCLLAVAVVGVGFSSSLAQNERRGTAGASELLVPVTARTAGYSSALTSGLVGLNPLEAVRSNPAGMTSGSGTSAIFSRSEYVADIGINYFGVGQAFGNNVLAITVNSWDFGDIQKTTETSPETGDLTYSANNVVFGVSYARLFTDRISAGFTIKGISETIDDVSATGLAFDAGMTYVAGESGLRFGVALQHFGPQMAYSGNGLVHFSNLPSQEPDAKQNAVAIESEAFELPSQLNVGLAYARPLGDAAVVTLNGNFASNSFSQDVFSGGLEFGVMNLLFIRGGVALQSESDLSFYQGYNFGAGLNLDLSGSNLTVDYAYLPTDYFDAVNMFSIGVEL